MTLQLSTLVIFSTFALAQAQICPSLLQASGSIGETSVRVEEELVLKQEEEARVSHLVLAAMQKNLSGLEPSLATMAVAYLNANVSQPIREAIDQIMESTNQIHADLQTQHNEDQKEINESLGRLQKCNDDLNETNRTHTAMTDQVIVGVHDLQMFADSARLQHNNCRDEQVKAQADEVLKCGEYDQKRKSESMNPPNCDLKVFQDIATDDVEKLDKFETCVSQMSAWLSKLNVNREPCGTAKETHEEQGKSCEAKQPAFEQAYCRWSDRAVEVCADHAGDCADLPGAHEDRVSAMSTAERARKLDSRAVAHIICVAKFILLEGVKSESELQKCKNLRVDTSGLAIDYGVVPELVKCVAPEFHPCSDEWQQQEYNAKDWYNEVRLSPCKPCVAPMVELPPAEKLQYLDYDGFEVFWPGTYQTPSKANLLASGWDQEKYITGINFRHRDDFLVMKDSVKRPFKNFEWYYTYNWCRGCWIDIYGSNTATTRDGDWIKVAKAEWKGIVQGPVKLQSVTVLDSTPYQYWKLVWVENTCGGHGPLAGWFKHASE